MPPADPQFATVSLLIGEDVAGTFRVPITEETTVRRLAKDAMQRLLTRRGDGRYIFTRENISVTEVFVNCGLHKAEVFAQDLVTHVVRVKEELLLMRLRLKDDDPTTTTATSTTTTTTTTGAAEVDETSYATTTAAEHENVVDGLNEQTIDVSCAKMPETSARVSRTVKGKEEKAESGKCSGAAASSRQRKQQTVEKEDENKSAVATKSNRVRSSSSSKGATEPITANVTAVEKNNNTNSAADDGVAQAQNTAKCRLAWGPEAQKYFPDNYVASPNKLMSKVNVKKTTTTTTTTKTTAAANAKKTKKCLPLVAKQDAEVHPPQKEVSPTEEEEQEGNTAVEGCHRPGWGPEAQKYFPDNYVANPNKLMSKVNVKKTTTTTTTTTKTTAAANAKKTKKCLPLVAKQDAEVHPPHKEVSPTEEEEEQEGNTAVEGCHRPGWGPEAQKYFPDNYVASPDRIPRLIREAKKREKRLQEEAQRKSNESKNDKMVVEVDEDEEEMKKRIDTSADSSISGFQHSFDDKQNAVPHSDDCTSRRSDTVMMRENKEEGEPRTAPAVFTGAEVTPQTPHGSVLRRGKNFTVGSKRGLDEMIGGTSVSDPVVVERRLMYDVADDLSVSGTPQMQSTRNLIEGNEERVEGQLRPPGWGKEALRFFDADTYFDDPSKAKLSPEILARPVRARREVVLPHYFAAISR